MIISRFIIIAALVVLFVVLDTGAAPGTVAIKGKPGVAWKNMFYYFVASERSPSKDPVVLWLDGGPGCSSMHGFVNKHGPFKFEAGKSKGVLPTLHPNPFSWSKVISRWDKQEGT